jgi:ribosome-binding protein aMBF1 (putative translation factor)
MIICDLCGEAKNCLQKEIEGKEYDICSECWNPFAQRLKGERPKEGSGYGVLTGAKGFNTTRK